MQFLKDKDLATDKDLAAYTEQASRRPNMQTTPLCAFIGTPLPTQENAHAAMPLDPQSPVRILVADDSEIYRRGVVRFLASNPQLTVDAEVSSLREMLDRVAASRPDVILMDLHMPGEGVFNAELLRRELQGIVVICMSAWVDASTRVMAQAWGCPILDKSDLVTQLLPTLEAALNGKSSSS